MKFGLPLNRLRQRLGHAASYGELGTAFSLMSVGTILILCFFSLGQSRVGLGISFAGPLGFESSKELNFWLGYVLFLFPGLFLLLLPMRTDIKSLVDRIRGACTRRTDSEFRLVLLLMLVATFLLARLGHLFILNGFPITDEEWGAQLGGQILASGHMMADMWQPFKSYMHPFMFVSNSNYTSFELPGVLAVWTLGDWLRDPALVWACVAAIPILPIMLTCRRYLPRPWALLAGLIYLFSPQTLTLSMTTHSHLLIRALASLALLAYTECEYKPFRGSFLLGLMFGLGLISRPYEFGALLLPFFVAFLFDSCFSGKIRLRSMFLFVLGLLGPSILFCGYNLETTGSPFLYAGLHPAFLDFDFPSYGEMQKNMLSGPDWTMDLIWQRWGANLANNLMGLWVWFFAPFGLAFVIYGAFTNRFTRLLSFGLLFSLVACLFHDNFSIHSVGPIDFSESAVALTLLATFGICKTAKDFEAFLPKFREILYTALVSLWLAAGVFLFVNCSFLHKQAEIHKYIYGFVDYHLAAGQHGKAVVLADRYLSYWWNIPEMKSIGSYVYEWRIPRPDLTDEVLYLRDDPSTVDELRRKFSDRVFYRLTAITQPPYLELAPVPH